MITEVDDIDALIEAYKAYCGDLCDDCIPEALRVALREKAAIAQLRAYAENAKAGVDDEKDAAIDSSVSLYSGMILSAKNGEDRDYAQIVDIIGNTLEYAKSAIDKKVVAP